MEINSKANKKIEEAFEVLDQINEVKISTSFKQNVLNKVLKEEKESILITWFTPKLQLVAMVIVLLVNVTALMYTFSNSSSSSKTDINTFAQEYNLGAKSASIIN